MPSHTSPSSEVQAARQALAERLGEIRLLSGMTGRAFSAAAGWSVAKTSRIERAVQPASADDIRVWCRVAGAVDQAEDLIASQRVAEGAYVEWRRLQRGGQRRLQESYVPLYERTRRFRSYQSHVIPGLLQTTGYARSLLARFAAHTGAADESAEAAAARMQRSRVLYSGRTFAFVLEEPVLRSSLGGPFVMAEQLAHVEESMALPNVSIGIIPIALRDRPLWTVEPFLVFDDERAHVELLSGRVTTTAPSELRSYLKAFGTLAGMAVYGRSARQLITSAIRA